MHKSAALLLVCACSWLFGCSAVITREGYVPRSPQSGLSDCASIAVKKNAAFTQGDAQVIGSIAASDSGFSGNCSMDTVLRIFREDACGMGADIINIIEEKQPDFWSTCYRARAELIRLTNRAQLGSIHSDPQYSAESQAKSARITECINRGLAPAGALGGLIGVLILQEQCAAAEAREGEQSSGGNASPASSDTESD